MSKEDTFTISEFAKFARTTRDTLIYYDRIGLLSPASRSESNYRFYSHNQLGTLNLIRTLQILGMPLGAIKRLRNRRTPELIDAVLENQIHHINDEIGKLSRARELLDQLKHTIDSHLDVDENTISIQFQSEAAIVLGGQNDYSGGRNAYDALYSFYCSCIDEHPEADLNYPVWGQFSGERIRNRDWVWPDRYYYYSRHGQDKRPAAMYAVGYTRGGYGQCSDLYIRLLDYIDDRGFEICGPAYEEYPLNELSVLEEDNYLIRVMITVQKRC